MTLVDSQVDPRPNVSEAPKPSNRFTFLDAALAHHEIRDVAGERTPHIRSPLKHARPEGRAAYMFKIPDDPRVTPFGRFLRRYSLDEPPQLINVWMSEMSLLVHSRSSSTRTGTFPSGRASDSISGLG